MPVESHSRMSQARMPNRGEGELGRFNGRHVLPSIIQRPGMVWDQLWLSLAYVASVGHLRDKILACLKIRTFESGHIAKLSQHQWGRTSFSIACCRNKSPTGIKTLRTST